jgi:hypothetical protein
MKRFLAASLVALLLVALAALVALGSRGGAASAAQYQYRDKPSLTLSITEFFPSNYYTIHVDATNYFSGSEPGGQLELTCGGTKGSTCGPTPPPWPADAVGPSGSFSFDYTFPCGSNVKSAVAVDNDGVRSNQVKGPC